jgi:hypothetical protein
MKQYNDQVQQELEAFYQGLSDEDFARAKAFFSDDSVNSSAKQSLTPSEDDEMQVRD